MKTRVAAAGVFAAACLVCGAAHADERDAEHEHEQDEHYAYDELIVTSAPLERTVEQLAQPTSVLTGDLLESSQGASIGETLAGQPGVSASYFGPVASRPVIRGQFGERVRVLTNGLDALDASALSEDHAIGLDSILAERIEIVRGPATLLYGSGAAGGLVNIVDSRIREGSPQPGFSGALSLGSDAATGKESGAVRMDFGTNAVTLHADYFRRTTDEVEIPGFAESETLRLLEGDDASDAFGVVENSDSSTEGGAAAISMGDDGSWVGFSVSRFQNDYGVPGAHDDGGGTNETIRIDLDQTRYDLRGSLELGGGLFESTSFRVSRNAYQHIELEGTETGTTFDTQATDARLEFRHASVGAVDGAIGLQYKAIDFVAVGDEAFVPPSDTAQFSAFLFEEFSVDDRFRLQFSGRAEHQELRASGIQGYDDWAFGASLGAVFDVSDELTLAANYGLAERHPNSTELYADGPHLAVRRFERGAVTLGNGLLEKETSASLDVTLRADFETLQFTLTGFTNSVADYILLRPTSDVEDDLQVFEFEQADVDLWGFEAELLFDILDTDLGHLHARLSSDYVLGEESGSGNYLPRLTPLRYGASLHLVSDRFEASVEATYHDTQDKTAENELPTESFTLVSAEISTRLLGDTLLLFLRGTNLGDEDARRHTSPLKDSVPLPARSLQAGLRWDF